MPVGKVILIGMNNPHSTSPEHALYPTPSGVAGHRLWSMMDDATRGKDGEIKFSRSAYIETFERRNLVRGDWNRALAATNAAAMFRKERIDERHVVLCGGEVVNAFAKAGASVEDRDHFEWFRPGRSPLGRWAIIPHPSGRSHTWNDQKVRDAARVFFKDLVRMALLAGK